MEILRAPVVETVSRFDFQFGRVGKHLRNGRSPSGENQLRRKRERWARRICSLFNVPTCVLCAQDFSGSICYVGGQGVFGAAERDEKWNFEESFPERVISAHKGTETSVLLSMSGAIQRPHIGEYTILTYTRYYYYLYRHV